MTCFDISPLQEAHLPDIALLLDRVFGPERRRKSSYRFREGVAAVAGLGFVAEEGARLIGSVQQWPVAVGAEGLPALLLGPLGVQPEWRGRGAGRALVARTLAAATAAGGAHVFLIGDEAYYAPLGFGRAAAIGVTVRGETADRVHHIALRPEIPPPDGALRPWRGLGRHTAAG